MAVFAKYDGIDGESNDAGHDRWIDVLSLDWGVERPSAGATGQGRRRGAAVVDDVFLTFEYDKAAPKLLESCLLGKIVPKLEIEVTAPGDDGGGITYLRYELKNVMVNSYRDDASGEDGGRPIVGVATTFEEITVTYTQFGGNGAAMGNVETSYKVGGGGGKAASRDASGAKRKKGK